MPNYSEFEHLIPALRAALKLADAFGSPYAVIGAIAVGLHAVPRATQDVDLMLNDERVQIDKFVDIASAFGFELWDGEAISRAKEIRTLFLKHQASGTRVDFYFGVFPFEQSAADNADWKRLDDLTVPICSLVDLIVLKAYAGRLQDLSDIEAILRVNPEVDRKLVSYTLRTLATALEEPSIWLNVENLPAWNKEN